MNWTIIIIETAILVLIFTAAIMIPLIKNPVWWIHDYPKDIQDRYFETHERVPTRFFSGKVQVKKGFANVKAVRLPGTEDMDKAYHQKLYHVIRSLWGMLLGLIPCLMASLIFSCIFAIPDAL